MKTTWKLVFCTLILALTAVVWADEHNFWIQGNQGSWNDPANWSRGVVPDTLPAGDGGGKCVGFAGSTSIANVGVGELAEFGSSAFWSDFWGPEWGATLNINGGRFIHRGFVAAPIGAADAPSNINVSNGGYFEVGELALGDNWWFWDAPYANLNVYDSSTARARGWMWLGGRVNLYDNAVLTIGGLVNMAAHGSTYARIDIWNNAMMLIQGSAAGRDPYQEALGWIANGQLIAFGGAGQVIVSQTPNGVQITAMIPEPATVLLLGLGGLTMLRKKG
ncbi:MAG: PEP-CTERM sorting domain-containing protein [Anaerohalosphaeraceae bacterium]